jgi:hypothetical protein
MTEPDWEGEDLDADDDESVPPHLNEEEESEAGWESEDEESDDDED